MSLDDDLTRWEAGSLSREDLLAAYPSSDKNLAGVLDLHERLTELGNAPVPYHESEWNKLREKLPDRPPPPPRPRFATA